MKRLLMLFGSAGCAVAQGVLYAACAGAWSGETDVLLITNGASAEAVERTSLLYARYGRMRGLMEDVPGDKLGFTAPLQLRTWPHALPRRSLAEWAAAGDDQLLCQVLFSRETAEHDLNTDLSGQETAARALFAELLRSGDAPVPGWEENLEQGQHVRLVLAGSLSDGWSMAGMEALGKDLLRRAEPWASQVEAATALLWPYAGDDEHAHEHAAQAIRTAWHTDTVYALGLNESDCASAEAGAAHLVEWLAASCIDSFFRAESVPNGLMSYRVGPGKLGWESFPAAYRVCFGSLMKASAAFRMTFEPVIRRGLTAPKWLRDKLIGWYAAYFRQAQKMDDEQRKAWLNELDDASALLEGYRAWMTDILRNLPPVLRSASAVEEARNAAAENYRQYVETASQLTVMLREAEESGLSQEKTVHRHDMTDNESEKMLKVFQQIEVKKLALAHRQEEMNRRIGGAAQLLMMKEAIRRLKAESAELHAQAEEAARRINEAEQIATVEEQHRIATARTKLQRMERYMAQVDASLALVKKERQQAKDENVRRLPPEIAVDNALPESGMFDPAALDKLAGLPVQGDDRQGKKLWAEAEAAWTTMLLPVRGDELSLAEMAGRMRTKEDLKSPVAALLRDVVLAIVKEVR